MSKVQDIRRIQLIGACCREQRKNVLGLTLDQFEEKTGIKLKTASNFENGRSGKIQYMFDYISLTEETKRIDFMRKLLSIMEEVL